MCGKEHSITLDGRDQVAMLMKIVCPSCKAETGFSVIKGAYQGPFRCWKCKEICNIKIANNELVSTEPFSQDELWKIKKLTY